MADFKVKVTAETQKAEANLKQLDKVANSATKERSLKINVPSLGDATKAFSNLDRDVKNAANNIKQFYKVAKNIPGIGDNIKRYESAVVGTAKTSQALASNVKATQILSNSFEQASSGAGKLVNNIAKLGFALFGIKEIVGVLQSAFGGLFQQTIGREAQLRQTILKTQTTLASTSKVFRGGKEITDPYEKILALTGSVRKNIDSIRERSIALAGVTSNEVIEVFGIVASQINQIGGSLKDAEDLAINFSAALGTFGIPLYQARQEIGSILRGDITMDSYLAKALGITNEDVAKARTQVGGVVKFLEDRLAASVAGQKIAAQGLSGVVSNIKDIGELIGQRLGAKLIDPLLNALAAVFENLFNIKEQIFAIVDAAGGLLGRTGAILRETRSRAGLVSLGEIGLKDDSGTKALNNVQDAVQDVIVLIEGAAQRAIGAIAQILRTLQPIALTVGDTFIRLAKSVIEIRVDIFESLARALANVISFFSPLVSNLASLLNLYSRFLDLPVVQEFARLAATMNLLKRAGMDLIINSLLIGRVLVTTVIPALGAVGTVVGTVIAGVAAVTFAFGKLALVLAGLAASFASLPMIAGGVAKGLVELASGLNKTSVEAGKAGKNLQVAANGFRDLGSASKVAGLAILKNIGWILAVQVAITVLVDQIGQYQKKAEETARIKRGQLAIERLGTTYRNVAEDADYATRAARDFERGLAEAEYNRATENIENIRKKLNDLQYEAKEGVQTWGEYWRIVKNALITAAQLKTDPSGAGAQDSARKEAASLLAEQARDEATKRKYEAQQRVKDAEKEITIQADKRVNLENEIKEIRIRQENEVFAKRQELAQKEVDIFRAAGELRIFQMEQANKKLLEGEEGASRTALDALNNYLSVRERGELEIEASKKSLAIEMASLEKELENYKLENAKTIAKIRKEAADYEQQVEQNKQTIARQGAQASTAEGVSAGFRVGSTGKSSGPHLDIRSSSGNKQSVIDEAVAIIKAWQKQNLAYIELSNARIDVKKMTDEAQLRRALAKEQQVHARRSGGGAIDIAVPAGTLVPVPATKPEWGGAGGWQARSKKTGNLFLHGLQNSVATPGEARAPASAVAAPKAPNYDGIGAAAVAKYESASRAVGSASARLNALQAQLTQAKTKEAFEAIGKALFDPIPLEQYRDQIFEAETSLEALAATAQQTYDPELLKLNVNALSQVKIKNEEIAQVLKKAKTKLNTKELADLEKKIAVDKKQFLADLKTERQEREKVLKITRQQSAIENLRSKSRQTEFDLKRAQTQAFQTRAEAFDSEDPMRRRMIQAELQIIEEKLRLEEQYVDNTDQVNAELAKFVEKARASAIALGTLDIETERFVKTLATIARVSKTIADGYRGFAKALFSGGDIKEAASSMMQSISTAILDMVVEAAFKPMEDMITNTLRSYLDIKDPALELAYVQEQQTVAVSANTVAIEKLTTQLGTAFSPSANNTLSSFQNLSGSSGLAFSMSPEDTQSMIQNTSLAFSDQLKDVTTSAKKLPQDFSKLQKTVGGVIQGLSSIALGIGGIQLMSEGGTYNTLMGLSAIFGMIGSVAGMFGTGGAFGPAKKATGGPVFSKTPYVVGEIGPELFVPNGNGTIIPTARTQALLASRSALGTGAQGESSGMSALDASRSALAASAALTRERQATASLTATLSAPAQPLNVSYESRVINSVEYVTAEQFQRGVMDAAERGRALTLGALKNSVKARRQVGI